jgi:hypothetical protein
METFISTRKLFQIDLPDNWRYSFEDNIYTFNADEIEGALQISVASHPGGKQFVLEEELAKKQGEHPTAHISELSEYKAIHYGLEHPDEKMLQYIWITGFKNVKILCTLTISSEQENQKLDENYVKIVEILDTLKIFPPTENG